MRVSGFGRANEITALLLKRYKGLTSRERGIIVVAGIVITFTILYQICQPVQSMYATQLQKLSMMEANARRVGPLVDRYTRLQARRVAIENEYKEVEFKEGALSYLENLIKSKAGVSSGFTIKDNPPTPFGGSYEQTLFSVKFTTTNLPGLVDFLREVTHGTRPLILSKVDVQRSRFVDRLEVDIDVSSIKKAA